MRRWKQKAASVILILVILLRTFFVSGPVSGNSGAVIVAIDAPAQVVAGSDFVARVSISNVTDFDAANYDVTYNAFVLQVIGSEGGATVVTPGLIGPTAIPIDMWGFVPSGTPGTIRVIQNIPGVAGVSGVGYLAEIHFHVIGASGASSNITLSNGTLSDKNAQPIAASWVGDTVHVASADTTAPTVLSTSPVSGGTGVVVDSNIASTFSEAMAAATISISSFTLTITGGSSVVGTVSYNATMLTATFDPTADLAYSTSYTATITTAVTDMAGNHLASAYSWSFTTAGLPASPSPPGGGGGVGPPPTYYFEIVLPGGVSSTHTIDTDGVIQETVEVKLPDSNLMITLPKGTTALTEAGLRLRQLRVDADENPPSPPSNARVIGIAYDLRPEGARFNPSITISFKYSAADLPPGITQKDLVNAWWDASAGKWVELESEVETETMRVTAKVSHFTTFAVLGHVRPAAFSLGPLSILPKEVFVGDKVNISVAVSNTGGRSGSYNATLKINGEVEETKAMTISSDSSQELNFSVFRKVAGNYSVDVNGVTGSFAVKEKPLPPTPPAAFSLGPLSISPTEVIVGEVVNISIFVANTGGESGTYQVVLKINGVSEDVRTVTLEPGTTEEVSFAVSRDTRGTYSVGVNDITGSFVVKEKPSVVVTTPPEKLPEAPAPAPPNWLLINTVIAMGLVAAAAVVLFVRKRQRKGEWPTGLRREDWRP